MLYVYHQVVHTYHNIAFDLQSLSRTAALDKASVAEFIFPGLYLNYKSNSWSVSPHFANFPDGCLQWLERLMISNHLTLVTIQILLKTLQLKFLQSIGCCFYHVSWFVKKDSSSETSLLCLVVLSPLLLYLWHPSRLKEFVEETLWSLQILYLLVFTFDLQITQFSLYSVLLMAL